MRHTQGILVSLGSRFASSYRVSAGTSYAPQPIRLFGVPKITFIRLNILNDTSNTLRFLGTKYTKNISFVFPLFFLVLSGIRSLAIIS